MTEPFASNSERGSFSLRQTSVAHTLQEVSSAIPLIRYGTVLDLFTGDGASIVPIQRVIAPRRIICAERSRGTVAVGQKNGRFDGVSEGDILIRDAEDAVRRLANSEEYVDFVGGFGVSDEYISRPDSFLKVTQSIVRPGGAILMTGPEGFVEDMFAGWQQNYGGEFVVRENAVHDWDRNMYLWVK
ncbi:MAG: class I SAM-dependent methyltransferase [Microgenomates group bacterium]